MFILWVNNRNEHLTLDAGVVTFDIAKKAERLGWVEVWDSAPSEFAGAKYAADNYGCFVPSLVGEPRHPLTDTAIPK